uniref:Uncharacterized protein TCIL3000_10_4390 n=1 Tax=Trypanosoma congolense (strain IL3000) TaxID=1068625 RepID=G0UWB0_TRYCI|nr:unnamed protein product [Trypanosoma congolense IL3000]
MSGSGNPRQGHPVAGYRDPLSSAQSVMMFCGTNMSSSGVPISFRSHSHVTANPATVFQPAVYGYPLPGVGSLPAPIREDDDADTPFEAHDNHLKAPITVRRNVVFPTAGSRALFNPQQRNNGAGGNGNVGGRNFIRICDLFQEGRCLSGALCLDVHVRSDYLNSQRQEMLRWLASKEEEFMNTLRVDPERIFRVFCADLKETVDVPIAALQFTKGLYVDPSVRARRARGGHQNQYAMMASQLPTACGLFLMDPSYCKWGRWCNQIHIEISWMQSKKREFEYWFNGLESRFNDLPPDYEFNVHDPQLKTGLRLPKASIAVFSRGLFQGSLKKAPSVCMLFQRNRCTANVCCNQIHVVPQYLNLYRRLVQRGDSLTEAERAELTSEMNMVLESYRQDRPLQGGDGNDVSSIARRLNPQATPYTPQPLSPTTGSPSVWRSGNPSDNKERKQTPRSASPIRIPSFPPPSVLATRDRIINADNCDHALPPQDIVGRSSPIFRGDVGCSNPSEDLVEVVDGDHSYSSHPASQSVSSPNCRSTRHTNNPYAFGGNSRCTASPVFGWVQPIRSAVNSLTMPPVTSSWCNDSGTSNNVPFQGRTEDDSTAAHEGAQPFSLDRHDLEADTFDCGVVPPTSGMVFHTGEDSPGSSPT